MIKPLVLWVRDALVYAGVLFAAVGIAMEILVAGTAWNLCFVALMAGLSTMIWSRPGWGAAAFSALVVGLGGAPPQLVVVLLLVGAVAKVAAWGVARFRAKRGGALRPPGPLGEDVKFVDRARGSLAERLRALASQVEGGR